MHVEFLSHWSGHLGREMNLNRYGHAGIPVVVLPHQVAHIANTLTSG